MVDSVNITALQNANIIQDLTQRVCSACIHNFVYPRLLPI